LRDETVAALLALCDERTIALDTFRFCTDPDDRGTGAGWFATQHDDQPAPWRDLQAGKHWENQADDLRGYTGIAWYRIAVDIPQDWAGKTSRLVLDGIDDSATIWVDGEFVDRRGDPATQTTVWLEPQTIELGERLAPGRHCIALRVVDHAGSGGLWRKALVTTGPAGILRELLR
jgi:beta-galactosidase/beta-glucuronidase